MNHFRYRGRNLYADGVPLATLAREVGTPTYVYSAATLRRHFKAMDRAFTGRKRLICYSVKANSNLAVLSLFAELGSGFDIVSGGELYRVLEAGGDPRKVVFSGVGKTPEEIALALKHRILCFNVESAEELEAIAAEASRRRVRAPIALRVNPDVDPRTHPYIATGLKESKFGIPMGEARELYKAALKRRELELVGLDCHIGSQLTDARAAARGAAQAHLAFSRAADRGHSAATPRRRRRARNCLSRRGAARAARRTRGAVLRELDGLDDVTLILEPGRVLVGNAGVLLTRVLYRKQNQAKRFVVVDAGMNDLDATGAIRRAP